MLTLESTPAIVVWLEASGIRRLVVISPHLDDAVFSLGSLLAAAAPITHVVTVFTEGAPDRGLEWALAGGFDDAVEEHAARRIEDQRAMELAGCTFGHLGLRSGQLCASEARNHAESLLKRSDVTPNGTLVLLPAGAGGKSGPSPAQRWWRRVLRRPGGSMAHPEHESTRDLFLEALLAYPVQLGFYAEIPYAWNEPMPQLASRLSRLTTVPQQHIRVRPEVNRKILLANLYVSQAPLVLGEKIAYRRRVLGAHENLFLVDRDTRTAGKAGA